MTSPTHVHILISMAFRLRPVLFILALALLIQNTCPFGAAGKSAVTASCENCPLKHSFLAAADGQKNLASASSAAHFPLYVFAVPKTVHVFQPEPVESQRPIIIDRYKDALPDELLRPPRA